MPRCEWCGTEFPAKKRGNQVKKYCDATCRSAWHKAARKFGVALQAMGFVSLKEWHDDFIKANGDG